MTTSSDHPQITNVKVVRVPSWKDFGSRVDRELGEIFSSGDRFIFRGQGTSTHKLESCFDREFRSLSQDQRRRALERIKQLFLSTARVHKTDMPVDEEEIWALGQHHGVATKMLDWTESRYVAAFFAFASLRARYSTYLEAETAPEKECVAIFALDTSSTMWIEKSGVAVVRPQNIAMNERLRRQRGLFTLNYSDHLTIEDYARSYIRRNKEEIDKPPLFRFDVPVKTARSALRDMQEMRISHAELFPGLDGVALEAMLRKWLE